VRVNLGVIIFTSDIWDSGHISLTARHICKLNLGCDLTDLIDLNSRVNAKGSGVRITIPLLKAFPVNEGSLARSKLSNKRNFQPYGDCLLFFH
jgi:hypothetical protein